MSLGIKILAATTVGTAGTQAATAGDCATIYIQADVANSAKVLYIGDSTLTGGGSGYAIALSAGQSWTFLAPEPSRAGFGQLDLSRFYVAGSTAGTVCHISYLERGR